MATYPDQGDSEAEQTVDSVESASDIIEALKALDGAGVTELANYLDMSKSGIHKQLATLVKIGFVTKEGHEYQLSFRFLLMGEYVKSNSDLYQIGASEVDDLATESGYYAYLTSMEQERAYCIHTAAGENAVSPNLSAGNEVSFHSTAAGKAILSTLPEERRARLTRGGLPAKTPATITDREELLDELSRIEDAGVSFEDEEDVPGMRGVGAPIESADDATVGAIAVTGPVSLLSGDHFEEELPALVRQTKNFIEVQLSLNSRDPLKDGSQPPKDLY